MSAIIKSFKPSIFRGISTTSVSRHQPRSLIKLKKLQAEFQCEDGRPVWLKAGFMDRVLYATTIVLCYTGVLMVFSTIYDNAKPNSWKQKTC